MSNIAPVALTVIRATIHCYLTCAVLSRNINILQDNEFMSANKMFKAKAKQFTEENDIDVRAVKLFPPAESWLANSNFRCASGMLQ